MSFTQTYFSQGPAAREDYRLPFGRSNPDVDTERTKGSSSYNYKLSRNSSHSHFSNCSSAHLPSPTHEFRDYNINSVNTATMPSLKKRKLSAAGWENCHSYYQRPNTYDAASSTCHNSAHLGRRLNTNACASISGKRDHSKLEDDDVLFLSRDEIERDSPSRKDGIDALGEKYLRYSYCGFVRNLGLRLELPQTTIGTAMVLCHRFFVRRSHACHDRFLIATAALFLSAKSEETARPLNDVLRTACEILHKQDLAFLSYLLPIDWFKQYKERVLDAEQMILTTLDFELAVQHPYAPLSTTLVKLGLSQTVLVNLALNLISEGLRSSLWLQFKPHHIAAGAAYLAAKFLNMNLTSYHHIWHEFQTTPIIIEDVAQQLMELLY